MSRWEKEWSVVKIKYKSNLLELSTLSNGKLLSRLAKPKALYGFHSIDALLHLAKDHVLATQPPNLGSVHEKWNCLCGSRICHVQDARTHCFRAILVIKFLLVVDVLPVPLQDMKSPPRYINPGIML